MADCWLGQKSLATHWPSIFNVLLWLHVLTRNGKSLCLACLLLFLLFFQSKRKEWDGKWRCLQRCRRVFDYRIPMRLPLSALSISGIRISYFPAISSQKIAGIISVITENVVGVDNNGRRLSFFSIFHIYLLLFFFQKAQTKWFVLIWLLRHTDPPRVVRSTIDR